MSTVNCAERAAAQRAAAERAAERRREAQRRQQEHMRAQQAQQAQRAHEHREPKHVDDHKADDVRRAARARFAHGPTPAQERARADDSTRRIDQAARAIDKAHGDDAQRAATQKAARTLKTEMQRATPDERARILDHAGGAVASIARGLDKLSGDETKRVVGDLAAATESAGPKLAHHIADPIARSLPASFHHEDANKGELVDAVKSAAADGKGALLATSLAKSAREVPGTKIAGDLDKVAGDAIGDARKTFDDARKKSDLLDARLAVTVRQWQKSGALSKGGIQAGIDAYKKAHADDYAAAESASKKLASLLPAAGDAARDPGHVGDAARGALAELPAIARRDSGARAIAQAVEDRQPYLAEAKNVAAMGAHPKEDGASFDNAILRSVAVGGPDLVKHGERDRLSNLVGGAALVVGDAKMHKALGELHDKIDALPDDLTGVTLGRQLAGAANTIASTTLDPEGASSGSATSTAGVRFSAVGAALGLGALAQDATTFDPHDVKSVLTTAGHAGMLGLSVASLAGKTVGRAGVVIGAALSAFSVGESLAKGDVAGAAAASLPLVGAGIGLVVGGPVGAGIGLAVGGAVTTALSLFGGQKQPDQLQEEAVDPFLKGAFAHDGVHDPETAAFRLRDVYQKGDSFVGVGDSLHKLAEATGQTPKQVLDRIAMMPSENQRFVTSALLDGEKKHTDPRALAAFVAKIEALGDQQLPDW